MDDFCRPTTCKYCGQHVYFIRHNGGAFWAEPPLGWPWMKHPCYDLSENETASLRWYEKAATSLTNPVSGMVLRCGCRHYWIDAPNYLYVKLQDNRYLCLTLSKIHVNPEGKQEFIISPKHGTIIKKLISSMILYSEKQGVVVSPLFKDPLPVRLVHEFTDKQIRLCKMCNIANEIQKMLKEQCQSDVMKDREARLLQEVELLCKEEPNENEVWFYKMFKRQW
jgi:hypothetical protein